MARHSLHRLTRNVEATVLLESFFIAAVASFLGIRWFLALTGYPRLGSNGIHIAHMLWGGLLMLVALLLLQAFLDRSVHHVAAVMAGLGFGTFIDEIGKFVTADNDYFYRPAVALIYGLFVISYLFARTLIGQRRFSEAEAIANALMLLAEHADGPIEPDDRAQIRQLLDLADPTAPLTRLARDHLAGLPAAAEQESRLESISARLGHGYQRVMASRWAEPGLIVGVIAYTALAIGGVGFIAFSTPGRGVAETPTVATIAQLSSTIVGAALVVRGVISLHASRAVAYHWFMRGLLVWILVTQVFVFYSSQLAGLGGLAVTLVAYGSLRYALTREILAGSLTP